MNSFALPNHRAHRLEVSQQNYNFDPSFTRKIVGFAAQHVQIEAEPSSLLIDEKTCSVNCELRLKASGFSCLDDYLIDYYLKLFHFLASLFSKMIWKLAKDRFRYVILLVGCACLTSISSNMLAFNIAQVCMGSNDTNQVDNKIDVRLS